MPSAHACKLTTRVLLLTVIAFMPTSASAALFQWQFIGSAAGSRDPLVSLGDPIELTVLVETDLVDLCPNTSAAVYAPAFRGGSVRVGAYTFSANRPAFGVIENRAPGTCAFPNVGAPLFQMPDVFRIDTTIPDVGTLLSAQVEFGRAFPINAIPTEAVAAHSLFVQWGLHNFLAFNPTVTVTPVVPEPAVGLLLAAALWMRLRRRAESAGPPPH